MPRRNFNISNRTCLTCGDDLNDLPYKYKYCFSCYTPTLLGARRSKTRLKRCSLCGKILMTEQCNKGYDYHLECYKKI